MLRHLRHAWKRLRDNTRVGFISGRAAWTPRGVHALRGNVAREGG